MSIAPSNYRQMLNANGYKRLAPGVDIPNISLAIESGESHAPVLVYYNIGPRQKVVAPYIRSIDDTGVNGQGNPVNPTDFVNSGYLGDAIGNWGGA